MLFAAAIVLLAMSGCYPYGRPQPANVPPDFPVYSTADPTNEVDGWTSPLPDGSKDRREHYDITWTTDAGGGDLYSYYSANLAKGDWVEQTTSSNGHGGTIAFNRSSKPTWGGTVYLADHKIHVIMGQDCPWGGFLPNPTWVGQ
jgi:hypothetical protein